MVRVLMVHIPGYFLGTANEYQNTQRFYTINADILLHEATNRKASVELQWVDESFIESWKHERAFPKVKRDQIREGSRIQMIPVDGTSEIGIILTIDNEPWGISIVFQTEDEYLHGPSDDGMREATIDQIRKVIKY